MRSGGTAFDDQAEAARRETHSRLVQVGELLGGEVEYSPDVGPVIEMLKLIRERQGHLPTPCPHLLRGPRPAFLVAWQAGRVLCSECWRREPRKPIDELERFTCDRCRRYKPSGVSDSVLQCGNLLLFWGLCGTCREEVGGS